MIVREAYNETGKFQFPTEQSCIDYATEHGLQTRSVEATEWKSDQSLYNWIVILENSIENITYQWPWEYVSYSYTIEPNTLSWDSDCISLKFWVQFAENANAKKIQIKLWGIVMFDTWSVSQSWGTGLFSVKVLKNWVNQKNLYKTQYSNEVTLLSDEAWVSDTSIDLSTNKTLDIVFTWVENWDIILTNYSNKFVQNWF